MLSFITRDQLDLIRAGDPKFNYDTAIPQSLYNDISEKTERNPCGHVVYVYQDSHVAGYLQACTNDGAQIIASYLGECGPYRF